MFRPLLKVAWKSSISELAVERNYCLEFYVIILLLFHLFLRFCDILWLFWLTYSRELNHVSASFLLLLTLSHSYYTLNKSLNEVAAVMCLLSAIKVHRLYLNLAALTFLKSWFRLELFQTLAETLIFGLFRVCLNCGKYTTGDPQTNLKWSSCHLSL